jgi:hypothetical protein
MTTMKRVFLFAAAALIASSVFAQGNTPVGEAPQGVNIRRFPDHAMRGKFTVGQPPEVRIDGKEERLAPGARIFTPQNMIVMSGSISGQTYVVNYTKDTSGLVKDVWVLSPEEGRLKPPAQLKRERDKAAAAQAPQ